MGRWRHTPPEVAGADTRVDMLWANMQLHHTHLPKALLARWYWALRENGFLMFSCLGPDSLKELRGVYRQMGWASPAQPFTDMHDWGDMLVQAGFAEPVMDMERITLSYASAPALLAELRALGRNFSLERSPLTRGKAWLAQLHAGLEAHMPRTDDGRMLLTFEVVYGHAHKGAPRIAVAASSAVSLADMRQMLGRGPSRVA
jgi:malonyl-CoA O-methyltransferase